MECNKILVTFYQLSSWYKMPLLVPQPQLVVNPHSRRFCYKSTGIPNHVKKKTLLQLLLPDCCIFRAGAEPGDWEEDAEKMVSRSTMEMSHEFYSHYWLPKSKDSLHPYLFTHPILNTPTVGAPSSPGPGTTCTWRRGRRREQVQSRTSGLPKRSSTRWTNSKNCHFVSWFDFDFWLTLIWSAPGLNLL